MNKAEVTKTEKMGDQLMPGDVIERDGVAVRVTKTRPSRYVPAVIITVDSVRWPGMYTITSCSVDEAVTVLHGSNDDLARWIEL